MRVVVDLLRGALESLLESLPLTEAQAGPFLAGMVWAFVLFWLSVLVASVCAARHLGHAL